jgi:hypothetical protein
VPRTRIVRTQARGDVSNRDSKSLVVIGGLTSDREVLSNSTQGYRPHFPRNPRFQQGRHRVYIPCVAKKEALLEIHTLMTS